MTTGDETVVDGVSDHAGPPDELGPLVAGRYHIVRWLGGGGMGRVYEALDSELDERVALKVLRGAMSEVALERFRREVKLTRRIQHRNVARMFDIGEHAGEKFLTMELVDGEPLTHLVGQRIPWERLRDLARQLCAGLAAAHATGIVHRDLKPDNVLIEHATQRAVIADFGIAWTGGDASVTQAGTVVGTPRYMAPEQLAGEDVDTRADLFSLGVMLYELASGTRPWPGTTPVEIAVAQATTPPQPLQADLPPEMIAVIEACLARDREHRPAGADAIAAMLASPDEVVAHPPAWPARPVTSRRRRDAVAVLPFRCGPDEQYLADWLHEDLIDILSTTPSLRLRPARVTTAAASEDPRQLGRELGVDHVVEGSLRRLPAGLRVSARLIGVADGFQIWARRADYSEAEVLGMSDRLAREIAEALSTRAATAEGSPPTDPEAVELYLRARAELRRFWGEHAQKAARLLEQALDLAPESREILGAFAVASAQAWVRAGEPAQLARARRAVEQALAANLGEAHLAAGLLRLNEGDLEGGAAALAAAVARAPMSAPAHESAARVLVDIDLVAEAVHHFETAVGLDPGRARIVEMDLARIDGLAGNWAAAEHRVAALTGDPDPEIAQLGAMIESRLAAWRGDRERAMAAARRLGFHVDERAGMHGFLARCLAGEPFDHARWRELIDGATVPGSPRRMTLARLQRAAEIALLVGEVEVGTGVIERASELGLIDIGWIDQCPLLAPIRGSTRGTAVRTAVALRARRVGDAFRAVAPGHADTAAALTTSVRVVR